MPASCSLVRQRSRTACVLDETFGCAGSHIWVFAGCRGTFRLGAATVACGDWQGDGANLMRCDASGRPVVDSASSSRPWSERLHAQPLGEDAPRRLADGCRHVFIDVGANRANHVRFLIEPHRFPESLYLQWGFFRSSFGPRFASDPTVCAFVFEPNPAQRPHLERLARHYRAAGRRVEVFSAAALERPVEAFAMGAPQGGGGMSQTSEWGFGGAAERSGSGVDGATAAAAIHVPGVDLARFVADEVVGRAVPPAGAGAEADEAPPLPPSVVLKLDPEGRELDVLQRLLEEGVLCGRAGEGHGGGGGGGGHGGGGGIDVVTWELHAEAPRVKRQLQLARTDSNVSLTRLFSLVLNRTSIADRAGGWHAPTPWLHRALKRAGGYAGPSDAPCRARFVDGDDETYVTARRMRPRAWEATAGRRGRRGRGQNRPSKQKRVKNFPPPQNFLACGVLKATQTRTKSTQ